MLVLLAAAGMLLNVARQEVWPVRSSVLATPARGRRSTGHRSSGRSRQTPAQKAKADAERTRSRPRPPHPKTRREERR
jgi:hypothetical protein